MLESPAAQQLGVTLDTAAVAAYAAQLQPSAVAAAEAKSGLAFPLKFDSLEAEVCVGVGVAGRGVGKRGSVV